MIDAERRTYIYILRDPDTSTIRYVGRTCMPDERLYAHRYSYAPDNNPRKLWVKKLCEQNKYPIMEIVETTTWAESKIAEERMIRHYLDQGCDLTNIDHNPKMEDTPTKHSNIAPDYITIKINKDTRQRLKMLAVRNDESLVELIDRMVEQEETKMETRNLTDNAWVQRVNELSQMVEDMNPAPTSQDDVNWWLTDGWSDLDDDDVTVLRREIKRKYEIE